MAGHLALNKINEPTLFALVDKLKVKIAAGLFKKKDFEKVNIGGYEVMRLSRDYAEDGMDIPCMFGKVNLSENSVGEENMWLAQNISVEVHLHWGKKSIEIKNIFWVA